MGKTLDYLKKTLLAKLVALAAAIAMTIGGRLSGARWFVSSVMGIAAAVTLCVQWPTLEKRLQGQRRAVLVGFSLLIAIGATGAILWLFSDWSKQSKELAVLRPLADLTFVTDAATVVVTFHVLKTARRELRPTARPETTPNQ